MRPQAIALLCGVVLVAGCKAGGGISTGELQPTAGLLAEPVTPGLTGDYVSLRQNLVSGGTILLDVVVTEITEPVSGIALTMSYPDGFSRFTDCEDGGLFPESEKPLCEEQQPGEIVIFRSTAPGPGVVVNGDRVILRLEFLVFGVAQGPLDFEGQNIDGLSALLDDDADPIPVSWFAGQLLGD